MARTVRNAKLDTRSARATLKRQKSPYWVSITRGFAVGYRKGAKGGVWVAKLVTPGHRCEVTLGPADDALDADGERILDYAHAQEKARGWLKSLDADKAGAEASATAAANSYTVDRCLDDYVADYKRRGGKALDRLEITINALIRPKLGRRQVAQLDADTLRKWHAALAEAPARLRTRRTATTPNLREIDPDDPDGVRRRRSTANRILTVLKAALNLSLREKKQVPTDDPWRRVQPFKEADAPKIRYLSHSETQRLVNSCDPAPRQLVQCALLTGCRYGEICAFRVHDFDRHGGTVFVRTSKRGRQRHVVLNEDGVALFDRHVAGKPGAALIFTRPDGTAWRRSHQTRPLRDACRRADIDPPASFHILRHTYATHLLQAGAPLPVIAANIGHADTRMTERHYAHLVPSYVAETIRSTMPHLGLVEPANIMSINSGRQSS